VRKTKHILLLTGLAMACIFLSNCKDLKKNYTVRGRLLHSCDNPVPVKGYSVFLLNRDGGNCKGEIQRVTTNDNGEFLLDYESACSNGADFISLEYDVSFSSAILVSDIKINENEDLGDIYMKNNGFYIVKIKTNQPYTSSDTLFHGIHIAGKDSYIKGPFVDNQIIDTLLETVAKAQNHFSTTSINRIIGWQLKRDATTYKSKLQMIYIEPCKKYNEVILDISK